MRNALSIRIGFPTVDSNALAAGFGLGKLIGKQTSCPPCSGHSGRHMIFQAYGCWYGSLEPHPKEGSVLALCLGCMGFLPSWVGPGSLSETFQKLALNRRDYKAQAEHSFMGVEGRRKSKHQPSAFNKLPMSQKVQGRRCCPGFPLASL